MAATADGAALTAAHRTAQQQIGTATAAQLAAVWPLLDPDDLNGTFARWLQATVPIVQAGRNTSAAVAGAYYQSYRAAEGVAGPVSLPAGTLVPVDRLQAGLVITGPAQIKRALTRGADLADAIRTAQAMSSAVGEMHALDGGRERIVQATIDDERALGWARATGPKCCSFCGMLASRGFVYRSRESASFQAHPSCRCTPEPTFVRGAALPPGSDGLRSLWNESTRGYSGRDARNAFRRALTTQRST